MSSVVTSVTSRYLNGLIDRATNIVIKMEAWQMRIFPDIGADGRNRVQTV
jgi:hypothetical protein